MPKWNKLLLHYKLKELLHPIFIWQGNWFGGETGLAGKLVWQGNWFGGETFFLLPLLKCLSLYLWWNKLFIMQKLVILPFCDFFKETKQMAVTGKKTTRKMSQKGSWEWSIQLESTIMQKMFNSSSTPLSF